MAMLMVPVPPIKSAIIKKWLVVRILKLVMFAKANIC